MQESSVVPKTDGIKYYIIGIDWFKNWVDYSNGSQKYPGVINSAQSFQGKLWLKEIFEPHMTESEFFFRNLYLKDAYKEETHFKVVDEQVWQYLYKIYGGNTIPRLSIAVPKEDGFDYVVELNLRRFQIYSYPKVKYMDTPKIP